ncbi:uncharacterized protein I206_101403 [Kwoniella pini CBS 10737]|uniref:Uncharacterized protein n=1 Tax=Kwoniella pini CBS 10737 TaxID=1296096 RepID=A0A1B9HWS3_9TREE|nr:uncharacterized protein I206_06627 [Kwoniella pini CBS 10737]OCF47721.1 hypothetical protein I206_06627 [Kwoniella pini CBS 10737]
MQPTKTEVETSKSTKSLFYSKNNMNFDSTIEKDIYKSGIVENPKSQTCTPKLLRFLLEDGETDKRPN